VAGGRERRHVDAGLGDQVLGGGDPEAGNAVGVAGGAARDVRALMIPLAMLREVIDASRIASRIEAVLPTGAPPVS
jgi:hypothetical protein